MKKEELENFLVEKSLYDSIKFDVNDYSILISLLKGDIKIDMFCSECNDKRIFLCNPNKIKIPTNPNKGRALLQGLDENIYKSIMEQDKREEEARFQKFISDNRVSNLTYICSKDNTHSIVFIILLKNGEIKKIGQYPSYSDVEIPQMTRYSSILGKKYYKEFKRAIQLYTCNVGIGSFVYLRRIIEKLVTDAIKEAIDNEHLNNDHFEYKDDHKHRNSIADKIKLLNGYLPDVLVNNPEIYGIVSKGIHELSEQDCLKYFPALQSGIVMILADILQKKERILNEKEFKKSIQSINAELKSQ